MVKALQIARNKHGFVALLELSCQRVDPPIDDVDQRSRLSRLASHCELDKQTLTKAVERESDPDLLTLKALANKKHTPYPLGAWLLSLDAIDADDLQRTLERHERPDLLSEKQLRALGLVDELADDIAFAYLDHWEQTLYLPALHRNPTRAVRRPAGTR